MLKLNSVGYWSTMWSKGIDPLILQTDGWLWPSCQAVAHCYSFLMPNKAWWGIYLDFSFSDFENPDHLLWWLIQGWLCVVGSWRWCLLYKIVSWVESPRLQNWPLQWLVCQQRWMTVQLWPPCSRGTSLSPPMTLHNFEVEYTDILPLRLTMSLRLIPRLSVVNNRWSRPANGWSWCRMFG